MLTEVSHRELFKSNFITEFDEVLRSLIIFGPASIFSDWTPKTGLNYKTCVVGSYQFIENSKKLVDGIVLTVFYTARQAIEEFSDAGKSVQEAYDNPKKQNDLFEFIYLVRPRNVNPSISRKFNKNMPFESVIVGVKDKIVIDEGGFPEFPYHCGRWKRPANEKDGRGIGTEIMPKIRVLDKQEKNFLDVGNRWSNPPYQVLDSFEGVVRNIPGAMNIVSEMDTIKALEAGMLGNFPINEKILARNEEEIHRAFFKNAFSPLEDLTGDRRTTLEIRERIRQTWYKIGPPVARVWYELLEGLITRSVLLLIRNDVVPPPPDKLIGVDFGIEFVGPFALELRSQQAKAFQEWVGWIGNMESTLPEGLSEHPIDYIDFKDAIPRMGRTFGVNVEDMASEEEIAVKQQKRMDDEKATRAMQAAQLATEGYSKGTKKPEEGSAAEKVMAGV